MRWCPCQCFQIPRFQCEGLLTLSSDMKWLVIFILDDKESQLSECKYFFNLLFKIDPDFAFDKVKTIEKERELNYDSIIDYRIAINSDLLEEIKSSVLFQVSVIYIFQEPKGRTIFQIKNSKTGI